jgi:hypothetical protein
MAGAFGFEKGDHYNLSIQCGERVLLPAVRTASPETLIITNGFSCHEQILQQAERESFHLAQVLQLARKVGREKTNSGAEPNTPEPAPGKGTLVAAGVALAGLAGAAGAIYLHKRSHPRTLGERLGKMLKR